MSKRIFMPAAWLFIGTLGLIPNSFLPGMKSDARADSFNAKPGAWEMTHSGLSSGMLVPPDVLPRCPQNNGLSSSKRCKPEPNPAAVQ